MKFNVEVGKKLFKARKNKQLSRAALGKIVNLHESTIKRYEDGQIKTLDIEKMKEFAHALDITPEYLMGWNEDSSKKLKDPYVIEVHELIKDRRESLNLTQEELASLCGVSQNTIDKWESGLVEGIKRDKMILLSRALKISPLNLLGLSDGLDISTNQTNEYTQKLIVYGKVCAGNGLEAFEEPIDEIVNPYPNPNHEFFALQVKGDSMNKVVDDGLYAVIKKQPVVDNGDIAVVLIDNNIGMLKRFYQFEDMVILRPDSTNPDHLPMTFVGEQINDLKILGKFIGFVSPSFD